MKTCFRIGRTEVRILFGNILEAKAKDLTKGVKIDVVVSTDDNYLTMASGVSGNLRKAAGAADYIREAQKVAPVRAGTVVRTGPYGLKEVLGVDHILHGTVIDYDTMTGEVFKSELIESTTANCLHEAERLGVRSILLPAFAAGSGGLSKQVCGQRMCTAIKSFLSRHRRLAYIFIVLYQPDEASKEENRQFVLEANLILDVPYNPEESPSQVQDFYGRVDVLEHLTGIITGQEGAGVPKRHAVILGGPRIGKEAILDRLYDLSKEADSPLSQDRCLVRLTFGNVHANTPRSFVYRKFLHALKAETDDPSRREEIESRCADPEADCKSFTGFLEKHEYPEVVFLIDRLPQLIKAEDPKDQEPKGVRAFWKDLDQLQTRVRFIYTAREEDFQELARERLEPNAKSFSEQMESIGLACITPEERADWVDELFRRYLGTGDGAPPAAHEFFEVQAGLHPYLISLIAYWLIKGLKEDVLRSEKPVGDFSGAMLNPYFIEVLRQIERPRRAFFETLVDAQAVSEAERYNLRSLAEAVAREERIQRLMPGLELKKSDDMDQLGVLLAKDNPRLGLHLDVLQSLEQRGCLVGADDIATVQFMAKPFADWLLDHFRIGGDQGDRPKDVLIAFLNPEPQVINTLFGGRSARLVSARRRLPPEVKEKFVENFRRCVDHLLHPYRYPSPGAFDDLERAAHFLLTFFATDAIKSYLRNPPQGATILLTIDDSLKEIPWELVLETAYAGDVVFPFSVGRNVVTADTSHNIRPSVRSETLIRALLIGNPMDDLDEATREVHWLRDLLRTDGRFLLLDEDVLIGSEQCQLINLLNTLSSGRYGLVHYSGHTRFDGSQSAWHLKDGKITTDLLTSALQNAPPVLVFSSSCESATGADEQPAVYENQTFDLPSAFLQAGVEAYVGTLWEVDAHAARRFVEVFYAELLGGGRSLGECLRRAKISISQKEYRTDRLAFILYGDPRLLPGDLFPVLR